MPAANDAELREILGFETIAVVGCSSTPGKDAHDVPAYLRQQGYEVVPINPYAEEIFGRTASDSLADVEEAVDVVNVFRPSEEVSGIVDDAVDRDDVRVIWMQLGISDPAAARRAEAAGKTVIQDRCMRIEHGRLAA